MRHRRRRRAGTGLVAGLFGALVVGCTAPSPFDAEPPASDDVVVPDEGTADDPGDAAPDIEPETADPDVAPDPDGPSAPGAPADPQASVCNDAVAVAAGETIAAQIAAIGAAYFESALGFASRRFQAGVEPETFEGIITTQYPILLAEPDTEFGPCAQVADLARIEVTVTAADGSTDALVYLLVREEGRWSIDGASSIAPPDRDVV